LALGQVWLSLGVTVLAYATLHLLRRIEERIARR
jgi:hypothetical protein